jgi:hypothetical protein
LKRFVTVTVALCLAVLLAVVWFFDSMTINLHTIGRIPTAITVTTAFWIFYFKWGWKWWPLSMLFPKPRVDGTWVGHLESDWRRGQETASTVVPIVFVVRQTFSTVVIRSFTHDREGLSDTANIIVKPDSAIVILSYMYGLREEFSAGAGTQQGAAELRLHNHCSELRGEYWTNTKTRGRLLVQHRSRKLAVSFGDAAAKWPVAEWPRFDA